MAAHGNFDSARCIRCGQPHSVAHVRRAVFAGDGNPCFCTRQVMPPQTVLSTEPQLLTPAKQGGLSALDLLQHCYSLAALLPPCLQRSAICKKG